MVSKKAQDAPVEEYADVTTTPENWEFETVVEESGIKVIFDTVGDIFVGEFVGTELITPPNGVDEPFTLYHFRGRDKQLYSVNESYKMKEAKGKLNAGDWVRLTYTKDIESSKGNPMKDIKVEVKKA